MLSCHTPWASAHSYSLSRNAFPSLLPLRESHPYFQAKLQRSVALRESSFLLFCAPSDLCTTHCVTTLFDLACPSAKITADGDCSHEMKRRLLLGRKVMTNLDSILKSRDITLPTKVLLVKAMVLPVVMYGCESWTVKKAEHQKIDVFELWCWRRLLRVPWAARRSN